MPKGSKKRSEIDPKTHRKSMPKLVKKKNWEIIKKHVSLNGKIIEIHYKNKWTVEVPVTSHIVEFDGASLQNPGPAGAGALIRAPTAQGGGDVWACLAPLGVRTSNHAEYSGAIFSVRAAARLIDAPVTALHCRGEHAGDSPG